MNIKLNQPIRRVGRLGLAAKCVAVIAVLLMTACSENEPTPPPPVTPCHPEQLPAPTITHETLSGENNGIIENTSDHPIEVSRNREFSSGKFTLQPGAAKKESLPAGGYHARWAANGTCPADSRIVYITIDRGGTPSEPSEPWLPLQPTLPLIDFESVIPYTEGSNQEWALWALAQTPNSAEKIRFYNFLLKAHSYLQIYDEHDYIAEYDERKRELELQLQSTHDEEVRKRLELTIPDDNWSINYIYTVATPFQLNEDEVDQVSHYLRDANPQLFYRRGAYLINSTGGQFVRLPFSAYYALAERRQETRKKITDGFDAFKSEFEKAGVNINNKYDVVRYVYDDIAKTLSYDHEFVEKRGPGYYFPRERWDAAESILGYFGDSKLTVCDGYAWILAYLLNRLGIPTIRQLGPTVTRDESGNRTGYGDEWHGWNIVNMGNEGKDEWYFTDATSANVGDDWKFLRGRGNDGKSPEDFLYWLEITKDRIYPECEIEDYPIPVSPKAQRR